MFQKILIESLFTSFQKEIDFNIKTVAPEIIWGTKVNQGRPGVPGSSSVGRVAGLRRSPEDAGEVLEKFHKNQWKLQI